MYCFIAKHLDTHESHFILLNTEGDKWSVRDAYSDRTVEMGVYSYTNPHKISSDDETLTEKQKEMHARLNKCKYFVYDPSQSHVTFIAEDELLKIRNL